MGVYRHVVLRDSAGEYVARVDPGDYGYSSKPVQAGDDFDTTVLPAVIAAVEADLDRKLIPIWVDDASGDGWDSVPRGGRFPSVPWDGPASLYDEPELPFVISSSDDDALHPRTRRVLRIALNFDGSVSK